VPDAFTLQAGSLCVVASRKLLVTGRRIALLAVEEVRRRVEAQTVRASSPFGLITEFFRALNDIGEGRLQGATERLGAIESVVLKRNVRGQREGIFEMRRDSIRIARDMAYKRTAMLDLARERPSLLSVEEFDGFNHQIHRYAALVEDARDYAEHCQFLLEELRAQVEEETDRNLYLPATLIASIWGMNVSGIPFSGNPNGFWVVAGLIAAIFTLVVIFLRSRFRF
jgi:zinc transporter